MKTPITSQKVSDEVKKSLDDVCKSVSSELKEDKETDHSDDDHKVKVVQDLAKEFIKAL